MTSSSVELVTTCCTAVRAQIPSLGARGRTRLVGGNGDDSAEYEGFRRRGGGASA